MELSAYETTFQNEDFYWWYTSRREIILHLRRELNTFPKPVILNIGCGTGGLSHALKMKGHILSLDLELDALKYCHEKSLNGLIQGNGEQLPVQSNSCDEIYALDLLEHLPNDRAGAAEIYRCLKSKSGFAIVTVPAFGFLWSKMDDIAHHQRRYRLPQLCHVFQEAGLIIKKLSYFNFFLFPIALVHKLSEKYTKKSENEAFLPSLPQPLNFLFKKIFSSEKHFLPWCRFPFGVSIIAVLKKN